MRYANFHDSTCVWGVKAPKYSGTRCVAQYAMRLNALGRNKNSAEGRPSTDTNAGASEGILRRWINLSCITNFFATMFCMTAASWSVGKSALATW